MRPGDRVEVRSTFDGTWLQGFAVAEVLDDSYRLVRLSDGAVLPATFPADAVRRERTRETWWI